jgi:TPR repeat protein
MNEIDSFRAEILYQIGNCLTYPKNDNPDRVGATLYFRQASALGHGMSSLVLSAFFNGDVFHKNILEAMKWLKLSAEQGCPMGMALYGWRLLNAIDVESHQQNGLDYIQRAADSNDTFGLYYLGRVRLEAIHSFEDKEAAFRFFQRAAALGDRNSIFHLGRCYERGLGIRKDIFKAIEYYKRAANLGETFAYY